ncbi:MAG: glycosyltransferase family 4 protein [Candidatus Thermoplasmatota archaeon]|nr:glycosyltransferase family 4 protein [Candidatus Thermoplasmatota archaeon]
MGLHIAMLSAEYPPRWGGMGSTVYHLSAALVELGHRITVITRDGGGKALEQQGVNIREVKWLYAPMAFTKSYGKYALSDLKKLHSQDPVDVVHLHCPMISWTESQFKECKQNVAPIVSSLHGSWLGERDGLRTAAEQKEAAVWANPNDLAILLTAGHYSKYERAAVNGSDVCVANSHATKEDFLERYSPPADWNCQVIHWGVDTEMFHPSGEAKDTETNQILAVGRLAARKGYGSLLRAFAQVKQKNPETKLLIVGRGSLKKRLVKQAKRLGISSSVRIDSGMPFDKLAEEFRNADLVVYPSYYEGQGLIPLEAMASGTPVATVNHGPLPEMVDDSVGALFTMADTDSMSSAILGLLDNPEGLETRGINGRERVLKNFTFGQNAEDFSQIYSQLAN